MKASVMAIVGVFIPILISAVQVGMRNYAEPNLRSFEMVSKTISEKNVSVSFSSPKLADYGTSTRLLKRYYVRDGERIEDEVVLLTERLEFFIKAIKYFARETSFDSKGFEESAASLSIQLADLESWVYNLPPRSDIISMLVHAEEIFHSMLSASPTINYFNIQRADQILLCKITQLNVGLYHLQNSHGMPDVGVSGYASTVRRLIRVASYMSDLFPRFKSVSFGVRDGFQSQLMEARKTLSVLAAQISQPETPSTS